MKRLVLCTVMGLALIASFGFVTPRSAGAYSQVSPCLGYALGYWYYANEGNEVVAEQWWNEGNSYGCGFEVNWNNIW
jgi:hypothetical protein